MAYRLLCGSYPVFHQTDLCKTILIRVSATIEQKIGVKSRYHTVVFRIVNDGKPQASPFPLPFFYLVYFPLKQAAETLGLAGIYGRR